MKLKTKLFINFTILLFILLNLFGYFLIQTIFIDSIDKAVNNGFKEYAVIYSNLKSGDTMSRLFFTDTDVIRIKNDTYLKNAGTIHLALEVRDSKNNLIYSTLEEPYPLPEGMDTLANEDTTNYMITTNRDTHDLLINKLIALGSEEYYVTYINNIDLLYQEKINYFLLLLLFDLIAGIASVFVIYYFANEITKPLHALIENINEIIHKNYTTKLENTSSIAEIKSLSDSFHVMNEEISSHIVKLESQNQEKQRFIDSLTHEIRTPLTSIIGYSSLYLHKNIQDPDIIHTSFKNIYDNGKRIESLTENLIKLITMDKAKLEMEEIDMEHLLMDVIDTIHAFAAHQDVAITLRGTSFPLMTDGYLLQTLFTNLIDNACKATMDKPQRTVEILMEDHRVIILDHGKGIPQEDLDKIFEPFFMIDKSRNRTISGFGLGLAICRSIMEMLNIPCTIISQEQIGTSITLAFKEAFDETAA